MTDLHIYMDSHFKRKPDYVGTILDPYKIPFTLHQSFDAIDPSKNNVFMTNLNDIMTWQRDVDPTGLKKLFKFEKHPPLAWASKNNLKIILDQSWEVANPFLTPHYGDLHNEILYANKPFMLENNFRYLTNAKDSRFYFSTNIVENDYWENIIVDSNLFEYNTRAESTKPVNYYWNLLNHSVPKEEKKYLFTMLTGEVRKRYTATLLSAFMSEGILEDNYYTSLISLDRTRHGFNFEGFVLEVARDMTLPISKRSSEWMDFLMRNPDQIIKHKPFDSEEENVIDVTMERRFPQQAFESLFAVVLETMTHPLFYTEKTFKHIMHGVPFFIIGPWYNTKLKEYYGYEIFEEAFDYSIEKLTREEMWPHWNGQVILLERIIDMIKNMQDNYDHYANILTSKSVQEKVNFNRNRFRDRSSRDSLLKDVQRIFYDVWE